jgi:hypothetical protein
MSRLGTRFEIPPGGVPGIAVSTGFWPSTGYRGYRHVSGIVRIMGLRGVCHRVSGQLLGRGLTGRSVCHAETRWRFYMYVVNNGCPSL